MSVSELIAMLSGLDQGAKVLVYESGELIELDAGSVSLMHVRVGEENLGVYVKAGQLWPGSLKAVIVG